MKQSGSAEIVLSSQLIPLALIIRISDPGLIHKVWVSIVGYTTIVTGSDLSQGIKLDDFYKNFICNWTRERLDLLVNRSVDWC